MSRDTQLRLDSVVDADEFMDWAEAIVEALALQTQRDEGRPTTLREFLNDLRSHLTRISTGEVRVE